MSDDVKITSFTETLPPLRYLIVSFVKEPLLIAAKHSTDTVIAEMIAITVNENAFF